MTGKAKKTLIILAASLTVVVVGWVVLVGSILAWGGVATVAFLERGGPRVTVPIPMAAVEVAVASGSLVFDADRLDMDVSLGEWEPLVSEILEVIDECPDAVLVQIEDGSDFVRVEKKGDELLIRVSDSEIDLRVSLPTRSVRRTVSRLMS